MPEWLCETPGRGRCFGWFVQRSLCSVGIIDRLSSFPRKAARLGRFQQQQLQYSLILYETSVCRRIKAKMLAKTCSKKPK